MEFLNPASLWLLLLGVIPVVLYLVRRRSKKVRVSTLVFFKTLAQEHQESAWMRRLKRWLSLAMTLFLLALAVFVLARLIVSQDDADRYRTVVILLDRSASMAVADAKGETRLEAAKRILRDRLTKVPEEVGIALIAYDQRPEVLQPRTLKRRELLSRLDDVETRPIAGRPDTAVETAHLIAGLEPPSAVWHLSDSLLAQAGEEMKLHELNLALPEVVNAGITAVQLRAVPLEYARYDVFVRVALNRAAPGPAKLRLNVTVGGIPSQMRELELEPGGESALSFRLNGSRDQVLRLALESERDDFALDDIVSLPLPEIRPILVAWIREDETEDPYTRFALSSLQESGTFELLKGNPKAWPLSEKVDAVIFDGWLPPVWPSDLPAVVINPPGTVSPDFTGPLLSKRLSAPVPYDAVRVGVEDHPVLFRVSSSRVALTQTALYEAGGTLEPLWFAGKDPILSAGEVGGRRLVVMGFSPGLSDRLPLTASFPLLMGNALYWCVDQEKQSAQSRLHHSGELAPVTGQSITWTEGDGRDQRSTTLPLVSDVVEMDRSGIWETDTGLRGSSHLLSATETDIPSLDEDSGGDSAYFAVENRFAGNFKLWLLSATVLLLLLESWLFHRHAVY